MYQAEFPTLHIKAKLITVQPPKDDFNDVIPPVTSTNEMELYNYMKRIPESSSPAWSKPLCKNDHSMTYPRNPGALPTNADRITPNEVE